jgi:hypothetical protein
MIMSKSKVSAVAVMVAAAVVTLAPAEASCGGRHGGMRMGGGMRMSSGNHHNHHRHFRRHHRPIYVAPKTTVTEETYSVKRSRVGTVQKAAAAKMSDPMGRMYDPAAMAWFDGKGLCWSGKQAWTLKSGDWYYGNYRWYLADGIWQTEAPEAPTAMDCGTVPVFAAKLDAMEKKASRKAIEPAKAPERTKGAPKSYAVKGDADKPEKADKPAECKKYLPSLGEMVTVPCQ